MVKRFCVYFEKLLMGTKKQARESEFLRETLFNSCLLDKKRMVHDGFVVFVFLCLHEVLDVAFFSVE